LPPANTRMRAVPDLDCRSLQIGGMISGSVRGFSPIGVGLVHDMVFNVLPRHYRARHRSTITLTVLPIAHAIADTVDTPHCSGLYYSTLPTAIHPAPPPCPTAKMCPLEGSQNLGGRVCRVVLRTPMARLLDPSQRTCRMTAGAAAAGYKRKCGHDLHGGRTMLGNLSSSCTSILG
jgi:hypothetical protein